MDLRKLKKLIDLVEESGISELELTEGEEKVRISRALMPSSAPVMQYMQAPQAVSHAAPVPTAAAPVVGPDVAGQYPLEQRPARGTAGAELHHQRQADHQPHHQPVGADVRRAGQPVPAGGHGRRRCLYL